METRLSTGALRECAICAEALVKYEHATQCLVPTHTMSCAHTFHQPCIQRWLTAHTSCPMCRSCVYPGADGVPADMRKLIDELHVALPTLFRFFYFLSHGAYEDKVEDSEEGAIENLNTDVHFPRNQVPMPDFFTQETLAPDHVDFALLWCDGFVHMTAHNAYGLLDASKTWLDIAHPLCTYDEFAEATEVDFEGHARRLLSLVVVEVVRRYRHRPTA